MDTNLNRPLPAPDRTPCSLRQLVAALATGLALLPALAPAAKPPSDLAAAERQADALLRRMTIEEKIGQTVLSTSYGATTGPLKESQALEDQIRSGHCGNVFNALTVAQVRRLQKIAVEETRLRVPLLFGYDVIHGYKTIFPICLGEAASWDLAAMERSARVAATEAAAAGQNWTFAPMVDIARDPRWGRVSEGAGEDPWLGSLIARARVRGFQGTNLAAPDTLLACAKHYAAYGAAQAGRDYHAVDMSERMLREVYLPPFHAAVEAGVGSVMTAFNELNGTPATANHFLLQQVLRKEWGFQGFVVSDYTSINEMVAHGSAADEYAAGRQALLAGVDLDMQGGVFAAHLGTMLARHEVTARQIHAAARRVLVAKARLGLLDDPYRYCDTAREARTLYAPDHLAAAYDLACKSLVLLKNDAGTLPLAPGRHIAVLGPLADAQQDLLGSWKGDGDWDRAETILAGIRRNNRDGRVTHARGCDLATTNRAGFAAALAAAQAADLVVLVLGEAWNMTGEAACRTSLNLPGGQTELLRQVKQTGKPIVVVLLNGRPLALEEENTLADALLEAWFPGTEGGRAVADVLFGVRSPSGRLPITFPRNVGQVPLFYAAKNTGRPIVPARPREPYRSFYLDSPNDPLFPFGYGLGYTTFAYTDLKLDAARLRPGGQVKATVTVANTGARAGTDTVQLYLRDLVGSVTRPVKELRGFQQITLQPGERRTVEFTVTEKELACLRADLTVGTEPGGFELSLGPHSRDAQTVTFELLAR